MTAAAPDPDPTTGLDLVVVVAVDPVARDLVAAGLLLGLTETALLVYEHGFAAGGSLWLRRRVVDATGVLYDDEIADGSGCACCRLRDDLVTTVAVLADRGRWARLLVSPPLANPLGDLTGQLAEAVADGRLEGVRLRTVVAAVDGAAVVTDVFGDDLLDERGGGLSAHDRRAVGETLVELLDGADLVVAVDGPGPLPAALTALAGDRWRPDWTGLDAPALFAADHDGEAAARRGDPLHLEAPPPGAPPVWSLDLRASRPVHPDRLVAHLEELGGGRLRGRGHLWLPTRPGTPCLWDGSGGQLGVGLGAAWPDGRSAETRLVVTGVDPADRLRVVEAFEAVLCTTAEAAADWTGRADGLDAWLGPRPADEVAAGREPR